MSQVIDAVLDTVTPDPALAGKVTTGGIVNAAAAVANTDGPHVVSSSPVGSADSAAGLGGFQVTFNEEINPATFGASQVSLTGPNGAIGGLTVAVVPGSNDHEFTISFAGQTTPGAYTLTVGPDIQDWYGNEMNQNGNGVNGEASDAYTTSFQATTPVFSVSGVPASVTAGAAQTFTVTALGPGGVTDTSYVGTVHFTSTDSKAVLPANFTFTAANDGQVTFSVTFKTVGTQSITATDTTTSTITGADGGIVVAPAAAATLKLTGFPGTDTAGAAENLTVTAYDAYGNIATGYTGTVHFTSTDPKAALPANFTFIASNDGQVTFSATLETAGTQSITATDTATSSIKGSETGITVKAAAATVLLLSGFPGTITAGAAGNVTVTAYDSYGNIATGYTGTVHFTSTDPKAVLPANLAFVAADNGKYSFPVTLETAGTQSITATDTATSSIKGSETGIAVKAAAAATLAVTGFPTSDTAGAAGNVTVTAYDPYGNVATGYTGTVHFTSTDPKAVLPANFTFIAADNGKSTFPVTLETVGTQSITVTDTTTSTITGADGGITVAPATASTFKLTGFPTTDTAGAAGNVTVTAYDAYGNIATGYTGTVHFTSTDPKAALPANFTFIAADDGQYTFSATLETAGTQSITATDTATSTITGADGGIAVAPAAAATLAITGFPSTVQPGAAQGFTVVADDPYGNIATGYTGTVHFTSTDAQATLPANYTFTATDAGQHAFSVTLQTPGTQSITATDTVTSSIKGTASVSVANSGPQSGTLIQTDNTTEGNWIGTYGTQGYDLADGQAKLPSYASITVTGANTSTWASTTADLRGLENAGGSGRTADYWGSTASVTINVNLTDGKLHYLSISTIDWDNSGRTELVQLINPATGSVLSSQTLTSFVGGDYLQWAVTGNVEIKVTKEGGAFANVTGVFLDASPSTPATTATTSTSASLVGTNTSLQGNWIGTYGTQGYDLADGQASLPSYAYLWITGANTGTWASTTTDTRGLENAGGSGRTADYWGGGAFTINVSLTDGQVHDLTLYTIDWDKAGRTEQVQVINMATGTVLSTQTRHLVLKRGVPAIRPQRRRGDQGDEARRGLRQR